MSEWRSIETAPKDGTPILAFWPYISDEGGELEVLFWRDGWWGWGAKTKNPTHWMPLAEPPK